MTHKRVDRDFFASHTVSELSGWTDFALEDQDRLTNRWRMTRVGQVPADLVAGPAFDDRGFHAAGTGQPASGSLNTSADENRQRFCTSCGCASSAPTTCTQTVSNMCHEASGRAMTASLGTGKGTCDLDDREKADLLLVMGVNAASNAPRMLTRWRGISPQRKDRPHQSVDRGRQPPQIIAADRVCCDGYISRHKTGTMNVQPRIGGDLALLRGVARSVVNAGDPSQSHRSRVSAALHNGVSDTWWRRGGSRGWPEIVHQSGVGGETIRELADVYLGADRTVVAWCLGLTDRNTGSTRAGDREYVTAARQYRQ